MAQNHLLILVSLICIGATSYGFYNNYYKDKNYQNYQIDPDHLTDLDCPTDSDYSKTSYEQMYKIIETAGKLDKDPYDRTIDPKIVIYFCKIANLYSINLETITESEFDFIYKKYIEYQIKKHT